MRIFQNVPDFKDKNSEPLSFIVGINDDGKVLVSSLQEVKQLLVGGSSGKAVSGFISKLVLRLSNSYSVEDIHIVLIGSKSGELSILSGIPHLEFPVISDEEKAIKTLEWCLSEMDRRYHLLSCMATRNIDGYNDKISLLEDKDKKWHEEINNVDLVKLPKMLVVIEELADMMKCYGERTQKAVCMLAQLGRACGMFLVIGTHEIDEGIITGPIKANIPSTMAFAVDSEAESRLIIGVGGAEKIKDPDRFLFFPQGEVEPKPATVINNFDDLRID